MPSAWSTHIIHTRLQPFAWSDHDMCTASFRLPCIVTRGRGTWKLDLSHLEDDEYKKSINEFWYEWQKEKNNFHDIGL